MNIANLEQQVQRLAKKGKPDEQADALYDLAKAYFEAANLEKAEDFMRQAIAKEATINRPDAMIRTHIALALLLTSANKKIDALKEYEQALSIAKTNNLDDQVIFITNSLGTMALSSHDLEKAENYYKLAQDISVKNNDILGQADALNNLATIERQKHNPNKAKELLTQSINLMKEAPDNRKMGVALLGLAQIEHDSQNLNNAIEVYKQALNFLQDKTLAFLEAKAHLGLADTYYDNQNIQEAKAEYEKAIELVRTTENTILIGGLIGLGTTYADLGDFEQAESSHKKAALLAQRQNNFSLEFDSMLQLSNDLLLKGTPEPALQKLLALKESAKESNDIVKNADLLMAIGRCYKVLGQSDTAMNYYQMALPLFDQAKDQDRMALAMNSLAVAALDSPKHTHEFQTYYQKAKDYHSAITKRFEAILDYNLAQYNLIQGKYDEASTIYQQALNKAKNINDKSAESTIFRGLGLSEYLRHNYQKAQEYYQQALILANNSGSIEAQWDANLGIGKAYKAQNNNNEALTYLSKAVDLVEKERGNLSRDSFKTYNLDFRQDCFIELIDLLQKLNRPYEALEIAERGRARAFLDMLANRGKRQIVFESTIQNKASLLNNVARSAPASPSNSAIVSKDRDVSIIAKPHAYVEGTAISPINVAAPTIEEIKSTVKQRGSTCVEYYILPDKIIVWVIDPDSTIHMPAPILINKQKLSELITNCVKSVITQPKPNDDLKQIGLKRQDLLKQVYQVLIHPIAHLLPKNPGASVTIIPHGSLFSVPFAALISEKGDYLIENYTLSYTPALGVLKATQKLANEVKQAENKLLAFGNPITPVISFLGALPYAEKEVKHVAQLFGNNNAIVKIGAEANKKAFEELAPKATSIHLATHGMIDEEHPVQSALVLAPTQNDDGLLTVSDIISLKDLKAKIVVLSACQTGRGKITGDGVVGLSRAFIIAGTPSVLVSQWNVDDVMTEYQMTKFYKTYLEGKGKSISLRQAQLDTVAFLESSKTNNKKDPNFVRANPRYWAAFQLLGEE